MYRYVMAFLFMNAVGILVFCAIQGILLWLVMQTPGKGDNMGLGMICFGVVGAGFSMFPAFVYFQWDWDRKKHKKKKRGE